MRAAVVRIGLFLAMTAACGPRVVEVRTAPGAAPTSLDVANRLDQAVNLSILTADSVEYFVRQVPAGGQLVAPVRDLPAGTLVTIVARPVDGSRAHRYPGWVLGSPNRVTIP